MFRKHATFILLMAIYSAINCSPANQLRAVGIQQLPGGPGLIPYGEPGGYQIMQPAFPGPQTSSSVSVLAHMANTPDAILWGLQQGANGIEFDLNFVGTFPSKFLHGSVCECSVYSSLIPPSNDHICSSLKSSCEVSTSFGDMTNFLGSSKIINSNLAVIYIDSKIDKSMLDYYEAGKNVVRGFNDKVMKNGFRGQIIISCPEIKYSDYLRGAYNEASKSSYVNQYFYTIDGEWMPGDEIKVFNSLMSLNTSNIVYSVGITTFVPMTFETQIANSIKMKIFAGIGIWTLEKESSMADYLKWGVNLIVTNTPQRAVNQCRLINANLPSPGKALVPSSTLFFSPFWNCDCTDYSGIFSSASCRITTRAPPNYACYCDNSCKAKNVVCDPTKSVLCKTPDVSWAACKLGGGNCGGY